MTLVLVRVSGLMVFAPVFSSAAIPVRVKTVFVLAVSFLLAPVVGAFPRAHVELGVVPILGELSVGLVLGLTLSLLVRGAGLCRTSDGVPVQLLAGESAGSQFDGGDAADGTDVRMAGNAGGTGCGTASHTAGRPDADLCYGSGGHSPLDPRVGLALLPMAGESLRRLCSWRRRCWRRRWWPRRRWRWRENWRLNCR